MSTPPVTSTPFQNSLTVDEAKARLETRLASSPLFDNAIVARVPSLDILTSMPFPL